MNEPVDGLRTLEAAFVDLAGDGGRWPVLVALDFDGTLAPLQDDPERSRILPDGVRQLERLAAVGVRLALVSGRGVDVLARLARVPVGTTLIGSHGGERAQVLPSGLGSTMSPLTPAQESLRAQADALLSEVAQGCPGGWVEAKPAAAVLHTRLAGPDETARAQAQAREVGTRLGLHVLEGKDVVELAVLDVDKGSALAALRDELEATTVVYAGDDRTDEHALGRLRPGDIGIKVGEGQTLASYRVPDPEALVTALAVFADALEARHPQP
ncbi:MAG: trehalose-phosphatase [Micrococcales bacterium]|nr:trehalose-phosphatase [Micrococcales bacterium]